MQLFRRRTYTDRYAPNWTQTAKRSHLATNRICCLCCNARSQEVHHVRYRDWRGAVAGRERPGVDVFPVCLPCHEQLHQRDAWIKDRQNPVLGNHQQAHWVARLRRGYCQLSGQDIPRFKVVWVIAAAVLGYSAFGWLGVVLGAISVMLLTH